MQSETIHDYFTNWVNGKELANKPALPSVIASLLKNFSPAWDKKPTALWAH